MSIDYAECLLKLYPKLKFSIEDNDINKLKIEDDIEIPSNELFLQTQIEINNEKPLKILRNYRDFLLNYTDKYSLSDYPHKSEDLKNEWLEFRQKLRDLTKTETPTLDENGNLINVNWPTYPDNGDYP